VSGRTTLNTLFNELKSALATNGVVYEKAPVYRDFRAGDVRHSQADISKIQRLLGYAPKFDLQGGLSKAMDWYVRFFSSFSA
jgi:UDP-N-acetylglucosamine 4-epimerase